MNEGEFEEFLHTCSDQLREKNDRLSAEHGVGSFARWDHNRDNELLVFSNPDQPDTLEATVTSIGSYSLKSKTWLWSWANESLTDAEREKAEVLKELAEKTGMRLFTDPHLNCDEVLAWELAAAAVWQLDSMGCYREPAGHLWIFVSIDSLATGKSG